MDIFPQLDPRVGPIIILMRFVCQARSSVDIREQVREIPGNEEARPKSLKRRRETIKVITWYVRLFDFISCSSKLTNVKEHAESPS